MNNYLFIATHKPLSFPQSPHYIPIQVGAALSEADFGVLRDDSGEHISAFNPQFCELTALYWLWKNSKAEIIGLVHYRRYFFHNQYTIDYNGNQILDASKLPEILLSENDIILPCRQGCGRKQFLKYSKIKQTVYENYINDHFARDWAMMEKIVAQLYPNYLTALQQVKQQKYMSYFNMFAAHKSWMNQYCEWLFSILFELQKHLDIKHYSTYQSRIYGFLAERLLNIYVQHHKKELKIHYLPVKLLNFEQTEPTR